MKILITGSSGMLGIALCKKLVDKHKIFGIDTRESAECRLHLPAGQAGNAEFYKIDLTDKDLFMQRMEQINPDITIHCAAYTDVDGCEKNTGMAYRSNVEVTENVAFAAKQFNCFLIYISTDFVFDGLKKTPYKEDDKPNPINVYGKTKLEGEGIVRSALNKYLIIRTSWLFGEVGKNFVDTIIEKAGKEKELKVVNDQIGSPTYIVDLADAIAHLATSHPSLSLGAGKSQVISHKILNITNSGSCSWYEFAREIVNLAGIKNVEIVPIGSGQLDRPAKRPRMSILDNSVFNKIYGKGLPNWRDALRRYLNKGENSK